MCASPALQSPCPASCARLLTAASSRRSRDTLNNLITKSPQDWQTAVGLPFYAITGTVIEWDECAAAPLPTRRCALLTDAPRARRIRFDVRLMQRVPYEGVSRMQTSLRRRHRDRVVRRGLGLVIESDVRLSLPSPPRRSRLLSRARVVALQFYATDAGREHFANRKRCQPEPLTPV